MKDLVAKRGLANEFQIDSAATSCDELASPVYPNTARLLSEHGIACSEKRARRLRQGDYDSYDYLIGMDNANVSNIRRISGGDSEHKVSKLLDFADENREIADPWYTRDFDAAWNDVTTGCQALLEKILRKKA